MDETLKRKLLSANYNKSKFLIIGNKKFRKETLEEIGKDPMTMGGVEINHSEKEKYLGDIIHENRCKESITEAIESRTNGLLSKILYQCLRIH